MGRRKTGPHGGRGGRLCRKMGCGFPIVDGTDGNGRAWWECTGCKRTAAGLCLDCPAPLDLVGFPRRLRCASCWKKHRRVIMRRSEKLRYDENPGPKKRLCRKYRKKNRKRLAAAAKAARDAERAKGPPTPIDRLYWREKTKKWRANRSAESHAAELQRRRDKRAAAKNPQRLEVAA